MAEPGAGNADGNDEVDGRRLRRDRNRDAVVDAMLALFLDGNLQPSSNEIAERAGLSPRSLFRYFDDIDDLCRAAVHRQQARVRRLLPVDARADAPLDDRVRALVDQRLRLFEEVAPVATVSRLRAPFQPVVATELRQSRAFLRSQVKRLFAPELSRMASARANSVLAALDVLCSFESHQLLRHDQGLGRARATSALVDAVLSLLSSEVRP